MPTCAVYASEWNLVFCFLKKTNANTAFVGTACFPQLASVLAHLPGEVCSPPPPPYWRLTSQRGCMRGCFGKRKQQVLVALCGFLLCVELYVPPEQALGGSRGHQLPPRSNYVPSIYQVSLCWPERWLYKNATVWDMHSMLELVTVFGGQELLPGTTYTRSMSEVTCCTRQTLTTRGAFACIPVLRRCSPQRALCCSSHRLVGWIKLVLWGREC